MAEPDRDPLERLRALAAIERSRLDPSDGVRAALLAPVPLNGQRRRTLRALIAAVVAVAGVGGVATAVAVMGRGPDRPEMSTACRSAVSLDADLLVVDPAPGAIEGCAEQWRAGLLPDADHPLPPGQPVPPLTACIGHTGVIEVYPGDADACAVLGLDPARTTRTADEKRIIELGEAIVDLNLGPCLDEEQVRAIMTDLIAEFDLDGWTISSQPSAPGFECARGLVDSVERELGIFFGPNPEPPPSPTTGD